MMIHLAIEMSLKLHISLMLIISSIKLMELKEVNAATMNFGNETDRVSLLAFRKGITLDPQGALSSWNDSSSDFCQWNGVTCGRRHQRITALELQGSGLVGWISPSIGNLTFLRFIDLSNNSFYGIIPQEIGQLLRLQYLSMTNNSLGGGIPSNLSQCFHLRELYLSGNNLEGKIPVELTTLSKLEALALTTNNLSGRLPHSIGNMSSLQVISLPYNNFEGRIPSSITHLRSLAFLSISENRFSGTLPAMIYNMSSIKVLSMVVNRLHGTLPRDIGHTLPNLAYFEIGGNQFSGTIPESLSNASRLINLELSENNFTGRVPKSLGTLESLERVNLEKNLLGSKQEGDLDFITSLTNCRNLIGLAFGGNLLGGALPDSFSNLSTKLGILLLGQNQIYGNIPPSIGNLTGLSKLGLEFNLFTGSIPSSLGMLQNLEGLYLDRNRLSGKIPPSLGNISFLSVLSLANNRLEGNIPSNLGKNHFLQTLDLARNNLSGTIPTQVLAGPSQSIRTLDLSINSLTGPLPSTIGDLKNLFYLDVSQNKLNGEIPATLGSCVSLEHLHLEANSLIGGIPMTLNALKSLSDLDLSNNNLSGPIPKYLESFPLLKLNLSSNNLEGEVPKGGAFGNSSAIFVGGNTKLCGGIGELHLPKCKKQAIKRGRPLKLKILVGLIVSVVGCLFLFFVLMYCRMRQTKRKLSSTPSMDRFDKIKLSYEDLLKATDGFSPTNLIGSGSFGCVYKGILSQDETIVAVKVLNLQQRGASKTFKAECNALRNIRHRNLVKILTSCSSIDSKRNDFKALVFEFMPNGSLEQWLHPRHNDEHSRPRKLSLVQRINILVDVASALEYLHHHCHTVIVHCDLKPSNILLDDDMNAHVGDFGLARLFPQSCQIVSSTQSSSIGMKVSIGYSAPEYGIGEEASTQGDVYSFGILLLEMIIGRRPTNEMFSDGLNLHMFAKMAIPERVMQIIDTELLMAEETTMTAEGHPNGIGRHNRRGEKMRECTTKLMKIGVECSKDNPRERMDVRDVNKELHLIRNHLLDDRTVEAASTSEIN